MEEDQKFKFRYYKDVRPLMSGFSQNVTYFLMILSSIQGDLAFS